MPASAMCSGIRWSFSFLFFFLFCLIFFCLFDSLHSFEIILYFFLFVPFFRFFSWKCFELCTLFSEKFTFKSSQLETVRIFHYFFIFCNFCSSFVCCCCFFSWLFKKIRNTKEIKQERSLCHRNFKSKIVSRNKIKHQKVHTTHRHKPKI